MKQLKVGDIMRFIKQLQKEGMVLGEIMELPSISVMMMN